MSLVTLSPSVNCHAELVSASQSLRIKAEIFSLGTFGGKSTIFQNIYSLTFGIAQK